MNKKLFMTFTTIGSLIGGYLPVWLFDVDVLSILPVITGTAGGLLGLTAAYKGFQKSWW